MIVPMKKVTLYALKQDKDGLLLALQKSGELMVVGAEDAVEQEGLAKALEALSDTKKSLEFINRQVGKRRFFEPKVEVAREQLFARDEDADEAQKEIAALERGLLERKSRLASLQTGLEALLPWRDLDVPAERLKDTPRTRVITGVVPRAAEGAVLAAAGEHDAAVQLLGGNSEGRVCVFYCHKSDGAALEQALKSAGLSYTAPPAIVGLPADRIGEMEREAARLKDEMDELTRKTGDLKSGRDKMEVLYDRRATVCDRLSVKTAATVYTVCITGWIRHDREERLRAAIESVTDAYLLSVEDPSEGETPPTLTQNNRFVEKFESVTEMFSTPDPREVDPNPSMAPWYWMIYGMMMADVGYGLVMLLAIGLFRWKKKPSGDFGKLVDVLFYTGFTTIFWGVIFGSYFGAELFRPILASPVDDPVTVLLLCLGVGLLHLFTGIVMAGLNDIKRGDVAGAIFDHFSWIVLLGGVVLLFLPGLSTAGIIAAGAGALVVLLTAGRKKKGLKKITGGLGGLYGLVNYVSDILSYSRILALALSTGVAAMVFNLMAGMAQGSVAGFIASIFIYLIGHIFNIAMGMLSAYVHTTRLQYIEFFGKFYTGNGRAFRPMTAHTEFSVLAEEAKRKS